METFGLKIIASDRVFFTKDAAGKSLYRLMMAVQ